MLSKLQQEVLSIFLASSDPKEFKEFEDIRDALESDVSPSYLHTVIRELCKMGYIQEQEGKRRANKKVYSILESSESYKPNYTYAEEPWKIDPRILD